MCIRMRDFYIRFAGSFLKHHLLAVWAKQVHTSRPTANPPGLAATTTRLSYWMWVTPMTKAICVRPENRNFTKPGTARSRPSPTQLHRRAQFLKPPISSRQAHLQTPAIQWKQFPEHNFAGRYQH